MQTFFVPRRRENSAEVDPPLLFPPEISHKICLYSLTLPLSPKREIIP